MSSASATPVPAAPSPAADTGTLPRPGRATVATLYDRGVDAYVNLWSSVILPAAHAVVAVMDLEPSDTVIDVGGGSGAVIPAIRDACPAGAALALDASFEMLRVARDRADASVAQSDALALPIRDGTADAVLLAFVLFHVLDPIEALGEAARALRVGGRVGTATWAQSHEPSPAAYTVWSDTLTEAGAPPVSGGRVDTRLDSEDAIERLLSATGFTPTRVWIESLSRQWTPAAYLDLATGSGMNRVRLDALDERTRANTLELARNRLSSLPPEDLFWSGDVVCAAAARR
jgi:SAM-dependent methyltransferase